MLQYFQYQLKGVSFLPKFDYSKYPQLPYEAISEEVYDKMTKDLKPIEFVKRSRVSVKKGCESPKKTAQRNKFVVLLSEKDESHDEKESPCEGGEGVGQVFPDAIAFCTNDHCQL